MTGVLPCTLHYNEVQGINLDAVSRAEKVVHLQFLRKDELAVKTVSISLCLSFFMFVLGVVTFVGKTVVAGIHFIVPAVMCRPFDVDDTAAITLQFCMPKADILGAVSHAKS